MQLDDVGTTPQSGHGRKPNQKLKPYLVMQYLLKNTDESHAADAFEICDFLGRAGIVAERRSIYRDIEDINKAIWIQKNGGNIKKAEDAIKDESERMIVYSGKMRGFYVQQRHCEPDDVRLLAECVYAAKFIPQKKADYLANIALENVSKFQAKEIKHDSLVVDRVKTLNLGTLNNISVLRNAMAKELDGSPHTPEKVSFKYLTHQISSLEKPVERRRKYVVSPYHLIINDSNYYLLAFDDEKQEMRTYRVDRMKDIRFTGQPRDGEDAFKRLDLKNYTQRVFSMYGGEKKRVQLRFINPLLDTVMDRFGTGGYTFYSKADDKHFIVSTDVEISDQFFGWLCGFGNRVRIETPDVATAYAEYLDKIRKLY